MKMNQAILSHVLESELPNKHVINTPATQALLTLDCRLGLYLNTLFMERSHCLLFVIA